MVGTQENLSLLFVNQAIGNMLKDCVQLGLQPCLLVQLCLIRVCCLFLPLDSNVFLVQNLAFTLGEDLDMVN